MSIILRILFPSQEIDEKIRYKNTIHLFYFRSTVFVERQYFFFMFLIFSPPKNYILGKSWHFPPLIQCPTVCLTLHQTFKLSTMVVLCLTVNVPTWKIITEVCVECRVTNTGVYKVPYNLIFFPIPIFRKFDFLPQNFSPLLPLEIIYKDLINFPPRGGGVEELYTRLDKHEDL